MVGRGGSGMVGVISIMGMGRRLLRHLGDFDRGSESGMRLSPFHKLIVEKVETLQRNGYERVLPWMVMYQLDINISERELRRKMAWMAQEGYLRREGQRMGYVAVPKKPVEFRFKVRPLNLKVVGVVH